MYVFFARQSEEGNKHKSLPISQLVNSVYYTDPYSVLSILDDQEKQEPLLEDTEENGFVLNCILRQQDTVHEVYFSVNGDFLYAVKDTKIQRMNLVTGGILSERFRSEEWQIFRERLRLVPVKRGVLFVIGSSLLELWNSELSVCIQKWTGQFFRYVVPLSEERVALKTVYGDDRRREVTILDTTSEKFVLRSINFDGEFLACNSKCEVLATTNGNSLQLWRENRVLWKIAFQLQPSNINVTVSFSPTEEYVIISDEFGSYVLDAVAGKVIFQSKNMDVRDIKFISNEDYIVGLNNSRGFCLRLYNVISGDLLSEIVEGREVLSFAVCPCKRLVAVVHENSEDHFEIIQVKLPGDKEKTNMKRSVETKFI